MNLFNCFAWFIENTENNACKNTFKDGIDKKWNYDKNYFMTNTSLRIKVVTQKKFTTSDDYGQLIYGWKDFL